MTRIIADISVSLDGFVTGPDPGPDTAARERAEAAASDSGKDLDVILMGGGATIDRDAPDLRRLPVIR